MTFPLEPTVPLPTWADGVGALKVDPLPTKRALGWTYDSIGVLYGEKPPFQWVNNELFNNGVWSTYFEEALNYLKFGNFDNGILSTTVGGGNLFYGTVKFFNLSTTAAFFLYPSSAALNSTSFFLDAGNTEQSYRLPIDPPTLGVNQLFVGNNIGGNIVNTSWESLLASDILASKSIASPSGFLFANYSSIYSDTGIAQSASVFQVPLSQSLGQGKYLISGSVQIKGLGLSGGPFNSELILAICNSLSPGGATLPPTAVLAQSCLRATQYLDTGAGGDAYHTITIAPYEFITTVTDTIYFSFLNESGNYGFYDYSASLFILQL